MGGPREAAPLPAAKAEEAGPLEQATKLVKAFAGVLGLSGVLYAIGFASLHAHYSLLGVSGKVTWSSSDVATEGGRFLYQLLFFPAALLVPVRWGVVLTIVLIAIAAQLSRSRALPPSLAKRAEPLRPWLSFVVIPGALLASAILLETAAHVASWNDVLRASRIPSDLLTEGKRSALFSNIEVRVVLLGLIGVGLNTFWREVGRVQKALIVAQWLVATAAVLLLPVTFGKLMQSAQYPVITHPLAKPGAALVALGQSDGKWVAWDRQRRETVLLPSDDKGSVTLGERVDLFTSAGFKKEEEKR